MDGLVLQDRIPSMHFMASASRSEEGAAGAEPGFELALPLRAAGALPCGPLLLLLLVALLWLGVRLFCVCPTDALLWCPVAADDVFAFE